MRTLARVTLLQAGANAVLLGLAWMWLGIPEAKTWQLSFTALLGLVIVLLFGWLNTSTLASFGESRRVFHPRAGWRQTPPVLAVFALFCLICWLLSLLPIAAAAQTMASFLTLHLRVPVRPARVLATLQFVVAFLEWIALPVLLLPLCSLLARGLRPHWTGQVRQPRYWAAYVLAILLGAYLPWKLIHFAPTLASAALEVALFAVRFLTAYLLWCAGIAIVAALSAGGTPWRTQLSTAARP